MERGLVSVVIPAYNSEPYIYECISSVLEQTYGNREIIVVLDCPTDNTANIVRNMAKAYNCIYVISNHRNMGAGASRMIGVNAARGEWVMTVDSDDIIKDDFIESLVNAADSDNIDIVSGGFTKMDTDGRTSQVSHGEHLYSNKDAIVRQLVTNDVMLINNKIIKRSLYNYIEQEPRPYIEDTQVAVKLTWYARKVRYIDNPGYVYRINTSSLTRTCDKFKSELFHILCWCDIMEFVKLKDPTLVDRCGLRNYIAERIKTINTAVIKMGDAEPYKEYITEAVVRMLNLITIESISFKIVGTEDIINKNK